MHKPIRHVAAAGQISQKAKLSLRSNRRRSNAREPSADCLALHAPQTVIKSSVRGPRVQPLSIALWAGIASRPRLTALPSIGQRCFCEQTRRSISFSAGTSKQRSSKAWEDLPSKAVGADGTSVGSLDPFKGPTMGGKRRKKTPAASGSTSLIDELGPDGQEWPALAKEVLGNMARFPGCVLLTRVGGFYESYFDQAPLLASLLGLKLANRTWSGRRVAMAGFPIQHLDKYLRALVQDHGRLVAMCEEFKKLERAAPLTPPGTARDSGDKQKLNENWTIERRVTRVVTPGTLIDEKFLDPFSNNYVLSISTIRRSADEVPPFSGAKKVPSAPRANASSDIFRYGLAWLDVSTADFNTTVCMDAESLRDEVARISPREVVLERGVFDSPSSTAAQEAGTETFDRNDHPLWEVLDPRITMISFSPDGSAQDGGAPSSTSSTLSPSSPYNEVESSAVARLTWYLRERLMELMPSMDGLAAEGPVRRFRDEIMQIDAHTFAALEVREGMREGGTRGSLASVVRRTVTRGGTRLLGAWLASPSTSLSVINTRQSLVAFFHARAFLREDLRTTLRRGAGDISRVLQRVITGRNDVHDLLEIRDFIGTCESVVAKLRAELDMAGISAASLARRGTESAQTPDDGWSPLLIILDKFKSLAALGTRLGEAVDEAVIEKRMADQEALARQLEQSVAMSGGNMTGEMESSATEAPASIAAEHGVQGSGARKGKKKAVQEVEELAPLWGSNYEHLIRPSSSKALKALSNTYERLRRDARGLEVSLQQRYTDDLSLKLMMGQGYVVHFQRFKEKELAHVEEDGMRFGYKSKTTRTYYYAPWTQIGADMSRTLVSLKEAEDFELEQLRQEVIVETSALRRNARLVNELDVLLGFAQLAQELRLVRPTVNESTEFHIEGGRHLSVEMGLLEHQRTFTKNTLHLHPGSRLHLITGPNMGGKSTFLRQNAVIAILAQTGSFVPADRAELGIVDRVFSRVGAKDDLFRDRSTFMVEMMETAEILRRATERSLVIADEIGRGTTTTVGIAIAFATLHELYHTNRCRALFATHFHELADMLGYAEQDGKESAAAAATPQSSTMGGQFDSVGFYCTDVEETEDGAITYSHRLRPGVNRESHGLKVARLAEMPARAVDVATATLDWLQDDSFDSPLPTVATGRAEPEEHDAANRSPQGSSRITPQVRRADLDRLDAVLRRFSSGEASQLLGK